MTREDFNPSLPISDKTRGGYEIKELYQREDGMWCGKMRGPDGTWLCRNWFKDGKWLLSDSKNHDRDLVNVAPAVNWGEEICVSDDPDKEPLQNHQLFHPTDDGFTRVVFSERWNDVNLCKEDGTIYRSSSRVINVPKQEKTVTVGVAWRKEGSMLATVEILEGGRARVISDDFTHDYLCLHSVVSSGGWRILIEPQAVPVPE